MQKHLFTDKIGCKKGIVRWPHKTLARGIVAQRGGGGGVDAHN